MFAFCKKCDYKTENYSRKRDISKQISEDGGSVVIYQMKDNICPKCKGKDTLYFTEGDAKEVRGL
ncbi:hypothetical protein [Natronincola ferrireducens]|uniref:Uncharacterized protein n=1 Tax=Natronincola ferrireducens TaxID=393762 RepID=A0A1G9A0X5_9FIRM|nr:hypothetical protein [Natronincola ferrireducens]SDK20847.1 hypothetical protein SAMN05660472_01025 [Natronincola ferrireducens]